MRGKKLVLSLIVCLAAIVALGTSSDVQAVHESTEPGSGQGDISPLPVQGRVPSFISAAGNLVAWTGATPTDSRTYLYDLPAGKNKEISASLNGSYYNRAWTGRRWCFQGGRTGANDDIFSYEVNNGLLTQITYKSALGDSNDWNPRVHGGRIVWEKDMIGASAAPGIFLREMGMGSSTMILAGGVYRNPDIWGDYVVCVKSVLAGGKVSSQIILHNLATNETTAITDSSRDNEHPRIADGKIVWASGDAWTEGSPNPWMTYQIMLYDIASGTTTALTNNVAGNVSPAIEGDLVAWKTTVPASIMVYDIPTDTVAQLASQGDSVGAPDIDGATVVWFGAKGLYTAVSPENATRFPDVPETHPNYAAIENMAEKEMIGGYTSGYFGPNDKVIRQQFAKMIVLTMGYTVTEADTYQFTDASAIVRKAGELYPYHYVAKAALTGLTTGYTDGSFRPLNNITRQQIITMVVRAGSQTLQVPPAGWKGVLSYSDPTHGQNIRVAEYNQLLEGIAGPNGGLAGWSTTSNATRAECAQILWNLYESLHPAD